MDEQPQVYSVLDSQDPYAFSPYDSYALRQWKIEQRMRDRVGQRLKYIQQIREQNRRQVPQEDPNAAMRRRIQTENGPKYLPRLQQLQMIAEDMYKQ